MEETKRQDDDDSVEILHVTKHSIKKPSEDYSTSDVVFDDGLQVQPPDGLTRFGEYYFRFMSKITDDQDYMDWLIGTFDENKRDTLEYLNLMCQTVYSQELLETVRMIGNAVLDGHTEHAINMTECLELDAVEDTELRAKIYMAADWWEGLLNGLLKIHYEGYKLDGLFEFMADIAYRTNRTVKLDKLCKEWDEQGYDRINLHINRARVLCRRGFLDDGLKMADAILTLEPTNPMAHLLRGNILATRGMHKDAINEFKEGLKYDDDALLSIGLAKSFYAVGQKQRAQKLRDNLLDKGVNPKILAPIH